LTPLVLLDVQHRLWAILLSGTTITTFVVTNVPAHPHLFAYIDNVKARSPAARMQTVGDNGVSPTIAAILKIAIEVETDAYFRIDGCPSTTDPAVWLSAACAPKWAAAA
jgi:hypothetical protein